MGDVVAPQVEVVRNATGVENLMHLSGKFHSLPGALSTDHIDTGRVQEPLVGRVPGVGQITGGVMEVTQLIPYSLMVARDVVEAAHADSGAEDPRMPSEGVHGMIGTHTAAYGSDGNTATTVVPDKRDQLTDQVSIVEFLSPNAFTRMEIIVEPTEIVDGVAAYDLNPSGFDMMGESVDHAEPL